jgi:hypothetical protein
MKKLTMNKIVLLGICLVSLSCKESFLDRKPIGVFSEEALQTRSGVQVFREF